VISEPLYRASNVILRATEAYGYAHPRRSAVALLHGRRHVLVVAFLLAGALLLRVDGLARPSVSTRELHNALLAREYYLGTGAGLPQWKQHVLQELRESVKPVEPPILDHVAAWGFRLSGGENLWIPRLVSAGLWVLGGLFLYLVALRITTRAGALVAVALYLFWPYGVLISRLYMPDPTMVALLLAGALAVIRYWERPSARRFVIASGVAAAATLIKPGVGLVFLAALFASMAVSQRERVKVVLVRLLLFVGAAATPTVAYFIYGSYIHHFLAAEGDGGERLQPHLLTTGWFWRGWWEMLSIALPFPQRQGFLAVVPLAAAGAGLVVGGRKAARAVLGGLGLGYIAYALALAAYTASHPYYALPLIPILALAIGTFVGFLLARVSVTRTRAIQAATALVVLVAAIGTYKGRPTATDQTAIGDYRRIGAITRHTTDAVIVDERLRAPAMYWGWIVGHYWYPPTPAPDLPAAGDPFPPWIDPARVTYLVVVAAPELRSERRLQRLTRNLPVVTQTDRFTIFDARGGRLAAAAARTDGPG
jgi:4-amino-4-deoxy-L-arabinose transferase-like glycosyltransferase